MPFESDKPENTKEIQTKDFVFLNLYIIFENNKYFCMECKEEIINNPDDDIEDICVCSDDNWVIHERCIEKHNDKWHIPEKHGLTFTNSEFNSINY